MGEPEGKLTAVQHQIMQVLWQQGERGATASEIWQQIRGDRDVGRTTVLKQIQRLEDRQWLRRKAGTGVVHFVAALDQQQTARMLASDFVEDFFGGSLCDLVMSALGSGDIEPGEVQRLRQLLNDRATPAPRRKQS